jgi:hypothetical protein
MKNMISLLMLKNLLL